MRNKAVCSNETIDTNNHGFFGPESHLWLNHRYIIRAIGYPVAIIIIFTHPTVYEIISSYITRTPEGLRARLLITKQYSFDFIFGDKRSALNASLALKKAHQKIRHSIDGVLHNPLEPDLMLWVFAALYYTSKKMNELLLVNIPFNEQTYQEYKVLGQLYGISEEHLPRTMSDFEQYWHASLNARLIANDKCKAQISAMFELSIADVFFARTFSKRLRYLFKPADQFIRLFCIYCIPHQVADALDLKLSPMQRSCMKYIFKFVRTIHALLPDRFTVERKVRVRLKR